MRGKNHVSVETQNEWMTPDGVKIMDEIRVIHFIDTPEGPAVRFDITLKATVCPITFGDTKEGSFGIRVARRAAAGTAKDGATVTTAEGQVGRRRRRRTTCRSGVIRRRGSTTPGTVDGKAVGIAVFDHPTNPHGELARPGLRAERGQPVRPRTQRLPVAEGEDRPAEDREGQRS